MQNRGVFFAPVVFRPGIVWGAGYVYTPAIAMDFGACQGCMFCGPCGYCFGNYYGPAFVGVGIYPWFEWHHRYGYDPCFAYCSWHYGPGWRERCVVDYRFRIGHPEARPPVTFALMVRGGGWGGPALAVHINVLAARGGGMRFERLGAARRAEIHRAVREQHVANERRAAEERRNAGHSALRLSRLHRTRRCRPTLAQRRNAMPRLGGVRLRRRGPRRRTRVSSHSRGRHRRNRPADEVRKPADRRTIDVSDFALTETHLASGTCERAGSHAMRTGRLTPAARQFSFAGFERSVWPCPASSGWAAGRSAAAAGRSPGPRCVRPI